MNSRNKSVRITSLLVALIVVLGIFTVFSTEVRADNTVDDFVTRCYKVAFGREPDQDGFDYWKKQITDGKLDGASVVYQFIFSEEYLGQNTTDEQYVTDLYTMFMGRTPEQEGYDFWCGELAKGVSRQNIFAGFANSVEFFDLCNACGITAGYFTNEYPFWQVNDVNLFVERLYKVCLGRIGDKGGQEYWVNGLLKGELQGSACAANFIRSQEYRDKDLSEVEYIKNLYVAMMGREYDNDGLSYWLSRSENGLSDDGILSGFVYSAEFNDICNDYGIVPGSIATEKVVSKKNSVCEYDSNNRKTRETVTSFDGEVLVYVQEYDADGYLAGQKCYDKNNKLVSYSKNTCDQKGRSAKFATYDKDNKLTGEQTYEYQDGLLKTSTFVTYKNGAKFSEEVFKYDSNEKVIDSVKTYFDNGVATTTETKYYFDGYPLNGTLRSGSKIIRMDKYHYKSGVISESWTVDNDGNIVTKAKFSQDGKMTSRITYYPGSEEKVRSEETYFKEENSIRKDEYDKNGKLVSFSITVYDENDRPFRFENYDKNGLDLSLAVADYSTPNVVKFNYYDRSNELIETMVETYDSTGTRLLSMVYYDAKGKETESYTYQYDANGKNISYTFKMPGQPAKTVKVEG